MLNNPYVNIYIYSLLPKLLISFDPLPKEVILRSLKKLPVFVPRVFALYNVHQNLICVEGNPHICVGFAYISPPKFQLFKVDIMLLLCIDSDQQTGKFLIKVINLKLVACMIKGQSNSVLILKWRLRVDIKFEVFFSIYQATLVLEITLFPYAILEEKM